MLDIVNLNESIDYIKNVVKSKPNELINILEPYIKTVYKNPQYDNRLSVDITINPKELDSLLAKWSNNNTESSGGFKSYTLNTTHVYYDKYNKNRFTIWIKETPTDIVLPDLTFDKLVKIIKSKILKSKKDRISDDNGVTLGINLNSDTDSEFDEVSKIIDGVTKLISKEAKQYNKNTFLGYDYRVTILWNKIKPNRLSYSSYLFKKDEFAKSGILSYDDYLNSLKVDKYRGYIDINKRNPY